MLLFLHGFLGCYFDWKPYIKYFSKNYNCIAVDLPGHGKAKMYDFSEILTLIPNKTHLVGYSMGGRIALQLMHSYPKSFGKVILFSSHLGLESEEAKQIRSYEEELWIDRLRAYGIDYFIKNWYEQSLFQNAPVPSYRYKQSPDLLIEAVRKFSLAKQQSFWNSLPKILPFTSFAFGEHDIAYRKIFERLTACGAKTTLIKECSHAVHLQAENACIQYIEENLR